MGNNPLHCVADVACVTGLLGAVFGWLPPVLAALASLLAAVYYGITIYDRLKAKKLIP